MLKAIFTTSFLLVVSSNLFATQSLFDTPVSYPVGLWPSSVFVADLDGDGDQDLIAANEGDNTVSVLKNNSDGTFSVKTDYAVGQQPASIFASDLDGDKDPDLITVSFWTNTISILSNKGDATFGEKVDFASGGWPKSAFAVDLDKDGDQDLAVLTVIPERPIATGPGGFVSILPNNGDGTLFLYGESHYLLSTPTSVFAADFDDDGNQDLAIAAESVYVFKNNGRGVFTDSVQIPLDADDVSASDLDGDGDIDLAASSGDMVWISKNNGDGTFETGAGNGAGGSAYKLFVSDLDGDGDRDIAVPNYDSNTVSILKNLSNISTLKGDLNRDAELTTTDAVLMLDCIFLGEGSNCSFASADLNCDGNLSTSDVVIELNAIFLGRKFHFPCI